MKVAEMFVRFVSVKGSKPAGEQTNNYCFECKLSEVFHCKKTTEVNIRHKTTNQTEGD